MTDAAIDEVGAFWSEFGYRGLATVWSLPGDALDALADAQLRRLVGFTAGLQRGDPQAMATVHRWLAQLAPERRVELLVQLAATLDP